MSEAKAVARQLPVRSRARHAAPPRHRLDADIAALDLAPVSFLVAYEHHWPLAKVDDTEFEYRCFLQLARDCPEDSIAPNRDCDLYWHAHILNLAQYLDDCQRLFGKPLLHYPFSGVLGPADAARQQARSRRSRRLLSELMNRVRSTHHRDRKGDEHEPDHPEVPDPRRYAGAVQGA